MGRGASQQQGVFAPVPGEIYLPPKNWAIPTDFTFRTAEPGAAAAAAAGEAAAMAAMAADVDLGPPAEAVHQPGLCVWHQLDTRHGLPKVSSVAHVLSHSQSGVGGMGERGKGGGSTQLGAFCIYSSQHTLTPYLASNAAQLRPPMPTECKTTRLQLSSEAQIALKDRVQTTSAALLNCSVWCAHTPHKHKRPPC